jgi:drug/metabolite transporter (DMT)-like permease
MRVFNCHGCQNRPADAIESTDQAPSVISNPSASPRKTAPARSDRVPLGILYMLGATLLFAASNALSKWQVAVYSFDEVLFFRVVASLVTVSLIILPRTGTAVFRTRRMSAHAGRSAAQVAGQSCLVVALSLMPLGGAVAINFSAPLFATLIATLWLKERVGLARGAALVIGFGGVLLVAAPGADSFRLGALFAVANALLYGSVTAAVRGMSATESPETLTIYQMLFMTAFFALGLPLFGFVWPTNADLAALLVNGVVNSIGQYWWTRSLSLAPPAAVGPFYYFSLVWAMVLGFVFWAEVPSPPLVAGSAIVVGSGLFLLWKESRKDRPRSPRRNPQQEGDR